MKYLEFRKILEKKNIQLFDGQSRVVYYRLLDTNKMYEINQFGGGSIEKNLIKPFYIFKISNRDNSIKIINQLLNNQKERFLDICKFNL